MIKWFSFLIIGSLLFTSQAHGVTGQTDSVDQIEAEPLDSKIQLIAQKHQNDIRTKQLLRYRPKVLEELHNQDVEFYKMIQRLARDFYAPVYKHRQSRGGRARLHKAILYLSELVEIHQTEEYGSNRKIERLFELRNNMERDLVILKEKPKVPNHIDIPFERDELPKIQHHVQDLFRDHATTEKKAKSIGGNIGVNVLLGGGGGVGASCGFTTDILGQKKAVIFGQGHVYNGVIPTINIGYYTHKVSGPFCGGTCSGVTGGLGIGGSYLFESDKDPFEHPSIEVGIALLGGVKMLGLIGIEICSLSMDWKTQRKNLSLTINTGKFPAWLNGDNIEELMDSYKKNKQKYRIAKKLYSTKPNSDVLSEHVEEVIEAS